MVEEKSFYSSLDDAGSSSSANNINNNRRNNKWLMEEHDNDNDNDNHSVNLLEDSDHDHKDDDDDDDDDDKDDKDDNDDDETLVPDEELMCYSKKDQNKQQKQQGNLPVSPKSPLLKASASASASVLRKTKSKTKTTLTKLPEESPTTKTLNSLSQNMDDLYGYDYNYNNNRSSNNNCHRTSNRSDDDDDDDDEDEDDNNKSSSNNKIVSSKPNKSSSALSVVATTATSTSTATSTAAVAGVTLATFNLPDGFEIEWEIIPIRSTTTASSSSSSVVDQELGVKIVRDIFPLSYNNNNNNNNNNNKDNNNHNKIMKQRRQSQKKSHCIVTKVKKNGWGDQHGLQENDWFLQPMTTATFVDNNENDDHDHDDDHDDLYDESQKSCHPYYNKIATEKYFSHGPLKLASFHEIQDWTRSNNDSGGGGGGGTNNNNNNNYRPVRILRKRRHNNKNNNNRNRTTTPRTSASTNKARKTPTTLTTMTTMMKTPTITTNKRKMMTMAKDVTPNTTTTTVTIPKVQVPCLHCGKLFQPRGIGAHQYHCKMNPTKENKAPTTTTAAATTTSTSTSTSTRGKQKRPSETAAAAAAVAKKNSSSTSNNKRKRTTSNSVTPSSLRRRNNDSSNDNGEDGESEFESESEVDDDDNDESVYNNARNRKQGKNTRRDHQAAAGATIPSRKTALPTKSSKSNKKKKPSSNKQQREDTAISSREEEATASTATAKNNSTKNDSSIIVSKPKWIPLYDNPWGEEGYQDGDVLLFGPQRGIGHYELHFPSLRYKTTPFEKKSMYNNTHCTPQEGLSVVCLNRDPLGNIPWGFNVTRHEFDHACLVDTIDMNSPASAAKFVGIPSSDQQQQQQQQTCSSGLNVNDMIIMINGKKTGGMTEAGFELELDLSTTSLVLVVSRYKHTEEADQKFALMEQQMFDHMDNVSRDNRLLGWQEIGNGATRMDPSSQLSSSLLMIEDSTTTTTTNNTSKYNRRSEQQQLRTMPIGESATTLHQTILSESNKSKDGSNGYKLVKNGRNGVHSKKKDAAFEHRLENLKSSIGSDVDERGEAHRSLITIENKNNNDPDDDDDFDNNDDSSFSSDQNPCMGCICGELHDDRFKKFWLQCESCKSWYDVAQKCIGFGRNKAENIVWHCEACVPPN